MSRTARNITSVITAVIVFFAAFIIMPPAEASAASKIKYSLSYSGNYVTLTLKPQKSSDVIYYTANGKTPTAASSVYKRPLASNAKVTIKAIEYNKSGKKVASISITIKPRVKQPKFSVSTSGGQKYLKISSATSGAAIYYTTDGSTPTKSSRRYSGKISYTDGTVVKARAYKSNMKSSKVAEYYVAPQQQSTDDGAYTLVIDWSTGEAYIYGPDDQLPSDIGSSSSGSSSGSSGGSSDPINGVFELVNSERSSRGISSMTLDSGLCRVADIRAKELAQKFDHKRPDGSSCFTAFDECGVSYGAAGENIAAGQRTPSEVMDGWMGSSGHRGNILSTNFNRIGIGCYTSGGMTYWVQVFTD